MTNWLKPNKKQSWSNPNPFNSTPILHHHFLLLLLTLHHHHHVTEAQSPVQPVPPLSSHRNTWGWDPSMAIVFGALIVSILLVAVFSAFFRRCEESYFAQQGNTEWPCSCSRGGINLNILETFPTLIYSTIKNLRIRKAGVTEDPLECAVCLTEFNDDDTLRLIPHCNHVFHPPCIDEWLSSHVTCPVCRANLTQDPDQVAVWLATTELGGGGKIEAKGSGNRASEQSIGCGGSESEIEGFPVAREGVRSGEEDKEVKECESKSKLFGKMILPRSNTTGHSVVEAEESGERFTLRLPEDVRKYIMLNHGVLMKRSASYNLVVSSRRGLCWSDSEGGSRDKRNMNMVGVRGQGGSVRGKGRV